MKKVFAIFCALCLMPSFSAHAWIGGPFSGNTHLGENSEDGVYEAAASTVNGVGLYRFAVGNAFAGVNPAGVNASIPSQATVTPGVLVTVPGISSGTVVIGAWGNGFTNVWFYEGVQYFGQTLGTVNPVGGLVIGFATSFDNLGAGANSVTSVFRARLIKDSEFLPASVFQGTGRAQTSAGDRFRFTVLGSKVSRSLLFGL